MPYRGSSLRPVAVGREVREGVSHLQGSADRAEAEVGWGAISVGRASWYARGVDHGLRLRGLWCRGAAAASASEAQAHADRGRRYGQSGHDSGHCDRGRYTFEHGNSRLGRRGASGVGDVVVHGGSPRGYDRRRSVPENDREPDCRAAHWDDRRAERRVGRGAVAGRGAGSAARGGAGPGAGGLSTSALPSRSPAAFAETATSRL